MRDLLTSPHNPFFRELIGLRDSSRARRDAGRYMMEGVHLGQALCEAGGRPCYWVLVEDYAAHAEIAALVARYPAPEVLVSAGLMAKLSDLKTPTGIVAVCDLPRTGAAAVPFEMWLDGIQDPGNVGTLLRTAAAAGVGRVRLSADCADAWSPRVLRAGMGAHFVLDIEVGADLLHAAEHFSGEILATALADSTSLFEARWQLPLALVLGSEGAGVSPALLARASQRIRIPMPGAVESLNVAAAAAICLFEVVRRRGA